jgi:hypothetical protein
MSSSGLHPTIPARPTHVMIIAKGGEYSEQTNNESSAPKRTALVLILYSISLDDQANYILVR